MNLFAPYTSKIAEIRQEFEDGLRLCDRAAKIIRALPESTLPGVALLSGSLMIYNRSREEVLAIIAALGGIYSGQWKKQLCPGHSTRLDYTAYIDGIPVQIYGVIPPETCRIIEEEVDVPAHKELRRTIKCGPDFEQASAQLEEASRE